MALDNAEKRRMAASVGQVWQIPGVLPENIMNRGWRFQVGWSYMLSVVSLIIRVNKSQSNRTYYYDYQARLKRTKRR